MPLKFYESPFHVSHDKDTANKMAMKMDLSLMISKVIENNKWSQTEAAKKLGVNSNDIADLMTSKIENLTLDSLIDMLNKLGFQLNWSMPSLAKSSLTIKSKAIY